jgi:superfamily II DNA or RNA helicase
MKSRDIIQEEALEAVLPIKRCGVGITMGGGKTLIGLRHMNANYNEFAKFLVVAPKRSIFTEWEKQAEEHKLAHLLPHITFTTYLSLPKQDLDYDVIYLDECHSLLFSHGDWLDSYPGKILGLTGTPPRYDKSEKGEMVMQYCPIVYEYTTDEAVESKILNDYEIIVHTLFLNSAKTLKVEKAGKTWYTSELASYEYWTRRIDDAVSKKEQQIMRIKRMKDLMEFPSKRTLAGKLFSGISDKVLLFANTQEQADSFSVHSYHSNNPKSEENLELFRTGQITKLTAVLQLNEGVNIPGLKQGIIMHAYGNERKAAQRIGRLLRLNPNEKSTVHILCYQNTVDEQWVKSALEGFDQSKITWI